MIKYRIRRVAATKAALADDAWNLWTRQVFRLIGAPDVSEEFGRAPRVGDDHLIACAYWNPLGLLLLYLRGWSRPDLGLRRWAELGWPASDPVFSLISKLWAADGQLDWFEGYLARRRGFAHDYFANKVKQTAPRRAGPSDPDLGRLTADAAASGIPNPLSGGGDPLHLVLHLDPPDINTHLTPRSTMTVHDGNEQQATFLYEGLAGWYWSLFDAGARLPESDRSWRVDVYLKPCGYIGTFRQSRKTGLWFTGKHHVHEWGN